MFCNIHRKTHVFESLFNKVAGLQACRFAGLQVTIFPSGIYESKVNNENIRTMYEICSKLTIKRPERHYTDLPTFVKQQA